MNIYNELNDQQLSYLVFLMSQILSIALLILMIYFVYVGLRFTLKFISGIRKNRLLELSERLDIGSSEEELLPLLGRSDKRAILKNSEGVRKRFEYQLTNGRLMVFTFFNGSLESVDTK